MDCIVQDTNKLCADLPSNMNNLGYETQLANRTTSFYNHVNPSEIYSKTYYNLNQACNYSDLYSAENIEHGKMDYFAKDYGFEIPPTAHSNGATPLHSFEYIYNNRYCDEGSYIPPTSAWSAIPSCLPSYYNEASSWYPSLHNSGSYPDDTPLSAYNSQHKGKLKNKASPAKKRKRFSAANENSQKLRRGEKKIPRKRTKLLPSEKADLSCTVCGDKANGRNFGAISCESCKAFWRRNALKPSVPTCSFESDCAIDTTTRKFCSECRLRKCVQVGMTTDNILDEVAKSKRKKSSRNKLQREKVPMNQVAKEVKPEVMMKASKSSVAMLTRADKLEIEQLKWRYRIVGHVMETMQDVNPDMKRVIRQLIWGPKRTPPNHRETLEPGEETEPIVKILDMTTSTCEHPSYAVAQYYFDRITTCADPQELYIAMLNIADSLVRRVLKFLKADDHSKFNELESMDQLYLIQDGIIDILYLGSAIHYNTELKGFLLNKQDSGPICCVPLDFMKERSGEAKLRAYIEFVERLHSVVKGDQTLLVLILQLNIFSPDRVHLGAAAKSQVEQIQLHYHDLLRRYIGSLSISRTEKDHMLVMVNTLIENVRNHADDVAVLMNGIPSERLETMIGELLQAKSETKEV